MSFRKNGFFAKKKIHFIEMKSMKQKHSAKIRKISHALKQLPLSSTKKRQRRRHLRVINRKTKRPNLCIGLSNNQSKKKMQI